MLAFQNLHQIVFNLSQVTSAISSGIGRVSTYSVKKKPDIDVFCNESFLRSLYILRQSENANLFSSLPDIKFGPNFEDIQWIYFKDVNIKFTVKSKVKENDLYIVLDKRRLKNCNLKSNQLLDHKIFGLKQKNLLDNAANHLLRNSKWGNSYVSESNFDKTKKGSPCMSGLKQTNHHSSMSSFICMPGNKNLFKKSSNFFSIQNRGFKTRRAIESEDKSKPWLSSLINKKEEILGEKFTQNSGNKSNKYVEMLADESLSQEDKIKLKVSFAEGYLVANKEMKNTSSSLQSKFFTLTKSILFIVAILAAISFITFGGRRTIFPFNLGHHGEVDPEEVGVTFSDVKGVEEVKEELQEIVEFLRNPSKFSSMGGKLPRGVLLVGPPGTGKTLLARAVAGEANVPFFHASGSEFDEIFVGEGARRVRNLFKSAKARAPAIVFIDEIDCVGSKRKSTMLHPYANQTINQLLSEMDGFNKNEGVIVLGATNRKSDLDSALLRPGRFDVEVLVPLPDLDGRQQILELYISKILSKNIDVEKIAKATAGCTGADLEAMINHAAIRAATEGASYVTMDHIENAKDKIMIGPERKSSAKTDEANLMTAYHEGGHTIVAYFSEGVGYVDKVTIVPRGESLGHTSVLPENEDKHLTKAMCLARMDIALGGRAAEELVFGPNKITANSSDDLDKATTLATNMIKHFGMSDKIGLRTLRSSEGELVTVNQFGQNVNDQVDSEVRRLIQESYERAKSILKKHAKEHKLLAEALIKYKTLNPEDVRAILGDRTADKISTSSTTPI